MADALRILFAVSEVAPFSKTGGLGDVASALPRALSALGHDVRVVTPRYRAFAGAVERLAVMRVSTPQGMVSATVGRAVLPDSAVPVYTVEDDRGWFDRDGLYQSHSGDFPDNLERFAFFSRAALQVPSVVGWTPHVIHCHDWQTALIPLYVAAGSERPAVRTVLTIHNMGFHGSFPGDRFPAIGIPAAWFSINGVEFFNCVNLLKGGLLAADLITTVSPTYAEEIQTEPLSHGLHGVLATRRRDLVGILNGIDRKAWNPATDSLLAARFSASKPAGKAACREDLLRRVNLTAGPAPVLALVTRLAEQKGVDLVIDLLPDLLLLDLRLVVLGTGDGPYETALRHWAAKRPDRVAAVLAFDESMAHRIMAGADVFLMPSRYEPCGLSQMYAMRYGAVPVAHQTGGLADTIVDYTPRTVHDGRATGFLFRPCAADNLLRAIQFALAVRRDRAAWKRLVVNAMRADFGWEQSATQYVDAYRRALMKQPRRPLAE
ncbi:MAG TPA: glycogen synthase GlgA [Nitrospiria bacterium]|nr:glycogen synthase GlgA [Nitrospiria bacterium]